MMDQEKFYQQAFQRNIGILTEAEQQRLRQARVAIAGLGGVGGIYFLSLARVGIGKFHIADADVFELPNINRQAGASVSSLGKPKVETMAEEARDINPYLTVKTFPQGIKEENISSFLEGVDVVLDGIDFFNIRDRLLLFRSAREKRIWVLTAAPIGFGASFLAFDPQGMSFEEYFDFREGTSEEEMFINFGLGLSPTLLHRKYFKPTTIDFSNHQTPSLVGGTLLCANFIVAEVTKLILGKPLRPAPFSIQFDPYCQKFRAVTLRRGNQNVRQRIKKWWVLRSLRALRKVSVRSKTIFVWLKILKNGVFTFFQLLSYVLDHIPSLVLLRPKRIYPTSFVIPRGTLIIANHQSFFDPFFITYNLGIKNMMRLLPFRYPVKKEFISHPILGTTIRLLGGYDIGETVFEKARGLLKTRQLLKEGYTILIFPEGKISPQGDLVGEFKRGIEFLLQKDEFPIVFVRLSGMNTWSWWNLKKFHQVTIQYSEVIFNVSRQEKFQKIMSFFILNSELRERIAPALHPERAETVPED